jgi:hypothetical protein
MDLNIYIDRVIKALEPHYTFVVEELDEHEIDLKITSIDYVKESEIIKILEPLKLKYNLNFNVQIFNNLVGINISIFEPSIHQN